MAEPEERQFNSLAERIAALKAQQQQQQVVWVVAEGGLFSVSFWMSMAAVVASGVTVGRKMPSRAAAGP